MYPIVYFDALRLKIRDEGTVRNKAVYLALGIRADGLQKCWAVDRANRRRQVLAQGLQRAEERGWHDILIAVVDGLRGFPRRLRRSIRTRRSRPASSI
jgi:transposase-like protein